MKKIVFVLLIIALAASFAFAAGEGSGGSGGTGPVVAGEGSDGAGPETAGSDETNKPEDTGNPEAVDQGVQAVLANQGDDSQLRLEAQQGEGQGQQVREQVQARVEERKQELEDELSGKGEKAQNVLRNQNTVRLAVHALLEMKDEIGGIGQNVSAIARDFNNSVQATIRAETRVEERSGIKRFFAGGDESAAEEIEQEVAANRARIAELAQLRETCPCDEETRALFQEQIATMSQEQERLGELAAKEKRSRGLLGWMWK